MTRKWIGRVSVLAMVAVSLMAVAACNTVEGIGRDIEGAGDAIEDAASRND